MNNGGQLPGSATTAAQALGETQFSPTVGSGFGGGKTSPQHFFGAAGELEFTPHNIVHSLIGGWMGDPNMAALDPIFWLHHCNIDRLWEVWLLRGGGRANPNDASWQTSTSFKFHNENGTVVSLTGHQVNTASQLFYRYEDSATERRPALDLRQREVEPMESDAGREPDLELAGASQEPFVLAGDPATVAVHVESRVVEARRAARAETASPPRVLLNLEDIEGEANPAVGYEVYVAATPQAEETGARHYLGTISFFGIEHASATGPDVEGPHGLRRTFDITNLVNDLRSRDEWSDTALTVSFEPLTVIPPSTGLREAESAETRRARQIPVRIGRISLFYA